MVHNNIEDARIFLVGKQDFFVGKKVTAAQSFDPHRSGTRYGILDELVGYAIRRAQLVVTEAFDARFGTLGITTQRSSALVLIRENPGLKQTELASLMGIARSGALAIVVELERRGLVSRDASATDQRAQALSLTARGAGFVTELIEKIREFDAEITADFTQDERTLLLRLSRRIGAAAKAQ
jgi:DNA-binding MarR family transcriptional regulator